MSLRSAGLWLGAGRCRSARTAGGLGARGTASSTCWTTLPSSLEMAEILDLRGRELTVPAPPVLADPSGRRARLLARAGRVLAVIALLWVAGLALAGLGMLPAGDVPLGRAVAGPQAPSGWRHVPTPAAPTAKDLMPAIPADSATGASAYGRALQHSGAAAAGQPSLTAARPTASALGAAPKTAARTPAAAPGGIGFGNPPAGQSANSVAAPGRNKPAPPGNSGSSPGKVRQAATTMGKSGSAPGHTAGTPGNGHSKLP